MSCITTPKMNVAHLLVYALMLLVEDRMRTHTRTRAHTHTHTHTLSLSLSLTHTHTPIGAHGEGSESQNVEKMKIYSTQITLNAQITLTGLSLDWFEIWGVNC